jgi:hypothetical protein
MVGYQTKCEQVLLSPSVRDVVHEEPHSAPIDVSIDE